VIVAVFHAHRRPGYWVDRLRLGQAPQELELRTGSAALVVSLDGVK
jgi:hypothetical protein